LSDATPGHETSPAGPVQQRLFAKLQAAFAPAELQVINESYMHSVPAGSESHFKVIVVSEAFVGQSRVARHRAVNRAVAEELASAVHAFSMDALTPEEWLARGGTTTASPECRGGSKSDT
jgi:BolA protein